MSAHPLAGRTALVTGVSRRRGIGFAVATRLAELGADVVVHHFRAHDLDQPWGADDLDTVRAGIQDALRPGARVDDVEADLREAASIPGVIARAAALIGRLDILVCNHARSGGDGSIFDMTPERLDAFWDANTRSTLLLTRAFAEVGMPESTAAGEERTPAQPGTRAVTNAPIDAATARRVFWMTSGQHDGPMRGEVAYATSKAALAGVTATVAAELLGAGIILNTINPGPVNTGYLDAETTDRPLDDIQEVIAGTPFGRFGQPSDPANLIGWLSTPEGSWIVGQVITSDGGFRLA